MSSTEKGSYIEKTTTTYQLFLGLTALLVIASFLVLHLIIKEQYGHNAAVNISKGQLLLSQRIAVSSMNLVISTDVSEVRQAQKELLSMADLLESSHSVLTSENGSPGLSGGLSKELRVLYFAPPMPLDRRIKDFLGEVRDLARSPEAELTPDNPHLAQVRRAASGSLFESLNAVADRHLAESARNTSRLQFMVNAVLAVLLGALLLMGVRIFHPLLRRIRAERKKLMNSRSRTRAIIQNTMDGVIIADGDGMIESTNHALESMFGYDSHELRGKSITALIPLHETCGSEGPLLGYDSEGKVVGMWGRGIVEVTGIHSDGTTFPVDISVGRMNLGDENQFVCTVRDISRRKALMESWKKFEFIANSSKEFMTLINSDYIYEATNRSYCKAQRKSKEEIIGKSVSEVWGEEVFNRVIKEKLDACFRGGEVHYRSMFEFATIGSRCMDVAYYPYKGKDGAVTHVVVVSRDVTDRKGEGEGPEARAG